MSQLTFYKYASLSLLLLNVAIIGFFLLTKPAPPPRAGGENFQDEVIEMLSLNEEQVTSFRAFAQEHKQKMTGINEQQKKLLRPYFESLANPSIEVDQTDALSQFQQLEREKIEVTYQHFQDLKAILDEAQLTHFERFIRRYVDVILAGGQKRSPPPKDRR